MQACTHFGKKLDSIHEVNDFKTKHLILCRSSGKIFQSMENQCLAIEPLSGISMEEALDVKGRLIEHNGAPTRWIAQSAQSMSIASIHIHVRRQDSKNLEYCSSSKKRKQRQIY